MAHANISDLYAKADAWADPCPAWNDLYDAIGPQITGTAKDRSRIMFDILALAQRSPLTFALYLDDAVHICHSFSVMPGDPIRPTNLDRKAVVMVGNDTSAAVPIVLHPNMFSRRIIYLCSSTVTLAG